MADLYLCGWCRIGIVEPLMLEDDEITEPTDEAENTEDIDEQSKEY